MNKHKGLLRTDDCLNGGRVNANFDFTFDQLPLSIERIYWNENNIQLQKCLAPNLRGPAAHIVVAFALEGSKEE